MPRDTFILQAHDVAAMVLGVAACGMSALFGFLAPWGKRRRRPRTR